jgi:AraC family transcriptional regulator, transcriptional activator of the genes for pyochelin and ferripyochelin receptors
MRIIQQTELDQIWAEDLRADQVLYRETDFESQSGFLAQFGQGLGYDIQLRDGISIQVVKGELSQALMIEKQHAEQFPLTLKFYLAGNSRVLSPGVQGIEADYEECCGHHYLYCLPDMRELEQYEAQKPIFIVYINLGLEYVMSFSQGEESFPTLLQSLLQGAPQQRFHKAFGKMSPSMKRGIQHILNCPYRGLTKQVYLESKALELFSIQLTQWHEAPQSSISTPVLRSADVERLYQAKALLSQTPDQPPSISELAQQVGLNRRKLHEGFLQLFGTTPFGALRNDRLVQAKTLLMNSELSIEAVAKQVGYRDRSSFAAAFRKQFGVNPKTYQLQQPHL